MTKGTITAIVANCIGAVVTVLLGVDWTHSVPSASVWIVATLLGINAVVHALTGTDGALSKKG